MIPQESNIKIMLLVYYFVGHMLLSGTMVPDGGFVHAGLPPGGIIVIEDMGGEDVIEIELIHERPKGEPTGRDLIQVSGPSVTVCLGPGECGEDEEYVLFEEFPYCIFELGTDTDLWKRMEGILNRINLFSETTAVIDYPSHDTLMVVYWQGGGGVLRRIAI